MTNAPKRRRVRVSLRAVFILFTICALAFGWLGWQLSVVRGRQSLAAKLNERTVGRETRSMVIEGSSSEWQIRPFTIIRPPTLISHPPKKQSPLPWIRRWLGDKPFAVVLLREESDCPDAADWFPEAKIIHMNRDGVTAKGPRRTVRFGPTGQ
jgi:hypothetical protein